MRERATLLDAQLEEIEAYRNARAAERVPVAPLALAVQRAVNATASLPGPRRSYVESNDNVSWSHLARIVWGVRRDQPGKGDGTRLKRVLGLSSRRPDLDPATTIDYALAVRIAQAAGLDPTDVDL